VSVVKQTVPTVKGVWSSEKTTLPRNGTLSPPQPVRNRENNISVGNNKRFVNTLVILK
jgi:hypothetical protein